MKNKENLIIILTFSTLFFGLVILFNINKILTIEDSHENESVVTQTVEWSDDIQDIYFDYSKYDLPHNRSGYILVTKYDNYIKIVDGDYKYIDSIKCIEFDLATLHKERIKKLNESVCDE